MQNIGHRLSCWMRFKKIEQYEIVMQILLILLAALAPVAILLWYIYFKDSLQLEPTSKMGSMGGMEGAGKIRSSVGQMPQVAGQGMAEKP